MNEELLEVGITMEPDVIVEFGKIVPDEAGVLIGLLLLLENTPLDGAVELAVTGLVVLYKTLLVGAAELVVTGLLLLEAELAVTELEVEF